MKSTDIRHQQGGPVGIASKQRAASHQASESGAAGAVTTDPLERIIPQKCARRLSSAACDAGSARLGQMHPAGPPERDMALVLGTWACPLHWPGLASSALTTGVASLRIPFTNVQPHPCARRLFDSARIPRLRSVWRGVFVSLPALGSCSAIELQPLLIPQFREGPLE